MKLNNNKIKIIGFIILFFIIIQYAIFKKTGLIERNKLLVTEDKLLANINNLKHENITLKTTIKKLQSDFFAIETYARDNFKMIKPDEILIRIEKESNSF